MSKVMQGEWGGLERGVGMRRGGEAGVVAVGRR